MATQKSGTSVRAKREQQLQQEQQRRRLYYGAAAIGTVLFIALLVVLRFINAPSLEDVIVPASLEAPATADGRNWGPPREEALVVIEAFADYQCPHCKEFSTGVGKQLADTYAASGLVRFEYHNYAFMGQESIRAAEAAECAADQNMFWPYHDILFANQRAANSNTFSSAMLKNFAIAGGLNSTEFNSCFDAGTHAETIRTDNTAANMREITSTPTVFINGERVANPQQFALYQNAINALLSQ